MTLILKDPVIITPRLLPGVRVGDAFISIKYADCPGDETRTRYCWYIDLDGAEYAGNDLQSGCQGGNLQDGLEGLLSFLSGFAEAASYFQRTGRASENLDLFPVGLQEWAYLNSDELGMLKCWLAETPDLIQESQA